MCPAGEQGGAWREGTSVGAKADSPELLVSRLGLIDYQEAWDLQRELCTARRQDIIRDVLLLLEHPHTYTLGRRGKLENILLSENQLNRRKIALHHVDRGGDVTYHGPDQLVGYPILRLAERPLFGRFIRNLEQALLLAVQDLGVAAGLKGGFSGVWVGNDKVCAIGLKIDAYGVTSHGFALNVNNDLSYFDHIVPCGIADKGVTSLQEVLGMPVPMERVMDGVSQRIAEVFGREARVYPREELEGVVGYKVGGQIVCDGGMPPDRTAPAHRNY